MGRRAGAGAVLPLFEADRAAEEAVRLERAQHDRMRSHEADLSPPDMAGQACWALDQHLAIAPARILDPTAGAGCFPMAARAQWPGAVIDAVEARSEEEPHLRRHAISVAIGDCFSLLDPGGRYDLVITNPPFSLIVELLPRCLELVRPGGLVAFVCRLTWGDKPEADRLWRPPFCLDHLFEFAGRWRFRVGPNPKKKTPKHPEGQPYGVDSVGYRLLVWRRPKLSETPPVSTTIYMQRLPLLPPACRRWRKTRGGLWVKPGTEYLHEGDLEAQPPVPWRTA